MQANILQSCVNRKVHLPFCIIRYFRKHDLQNNADSRIFIALCSMTASLQARVAELADALVLEASAHKACGFKSLLSHCAVALPKWRNWQTHQTQNLAKLQTSCEFDSRLRHIHLFFCFLCTLSPYLCFSACFQYLRQRTSHPLKPLK